MKNIVEIDSLKIGDKFKKINLSYKDDSICTVKEITKNIVIFTCDGGHVEFGICKNNYYVEKIN